MESHAALFFLGAGGALASELLKLYELKGKLTTAKYQRLSRSPLFWAVGAGMLLSSGFVAWAVNSGDTAQPLQVVLTGIGASRILRGGGETTVANRGSRLGASTGEDSVRLSEVFQ